jgi:hypothetical protein
MATIKLPPRSNSIVFTEEELKAHLEALDDLQRGSAVIVGETQDTEGKARDRAKRVKDLLKEEPYNVNVKAHSVPGDGGFVPAISLPVPD